MSNTRKANGNGPLRQERYASSEEYERGLVANLVAKRCGKLNRAEDRNIVWFLQLLSHQDGGLKRVADELCTRFPDRIATPAMQHLGAKPGQIYNAKQVEQVRAEIPSGELDFILKGETDIAAFVNVPDEPTDPVERYAGTWRQNRESALSRIQDDAAKHPASYAAADFSTRCRSAAAQHLERQLCDLCLDPSLPLTDGSPWYFPALISTLREYQTSWIEQRRAAVVVTSIGQKVYDALEYARDTRCMVLIEGEAVTGKTFAAKAWCEQNPGRARYVQVPSTNDEIGFFREIAKALGIASGLGWKAVQLRARIEDVLQSGQLAIVFDVAQFLFPTNDCRNTMPGRINWVQTALVNYNVPVALVATPQFMVTNNMMERKTFWNSAELIGRFGDYVKLPETLNRADLEAVSKSMLPTSDEWCVRAVARYAESSEKYLSGVKSAAARARFIARRDSREQVMAADIKLMLKEIIPSDTALKKARNSPEKPRRVRVENASAQPLQPRFTAPEPSTQPPAATREISPGIERNRLADLDAVPG